MRMRMKQVIKDVARVFNVPYDEVNNFTKNIPDTDENGNSIEHIDNLENIPGGREFITKYPKIIQYAKLLEDTPRALSQHPSGIAVTPFEITDIMPVTLGKPTAKDIEPGYLAQAEMGNFEKAGLVKLDILKLAALSQLDLMFKALKQYYPIEAMQLMNGEIKLENIPLDDSKSYQILCDLDLTGIFQMDNVKVSTPVINQIKPKNIHEVAAVTALIRPGSGQFDNYVKLKNNPQLQAKIDPRIDRWLEKTYGVILYQEQRDKILI